MKRTAKGFATSVLTVGVVGLALTSLNASAQEPSAAPTISPELAAVFVPLTPTRVFDTRPAPNG